ncbi:MAG: glycosyltransferase family 39 protein [Candidatus Marinimicrobia bacterium]|nr:glycosyltransferase family 39 protein [Candidatus Neomarinimicrobiota bacterium]
MSNKRKKAKKGKIKNISYNKNKPFYFSNINKYFKFLVLIFVFIAIYSYIFDSKFDLNGDNFVYYFLGKQIASGKGYTVPLQPDNPPAKKFPPGYPVIIALVLKLFGDSVVLLKVLNGLLFLGSILITFLLIKELTGIPNLSFVISILLLLNKFLCRFSTILMSEIPYLFFTLLSIFILNKVVTEERPERSKQFYLIIVTSILAFYIRPVGLSLLVSIILFLLFKKRLKLAVIASAGFLLLYLPWMIRNFIFGIKSRYFNVIFISNPWRPETGKVSTITDFLNKIVNNFNEIALKGFIDVIFPFIKINYNTNSALGILAGFIVLFVIFYGAIKVKKINLFLLFYLITNLGILILWHGGNGPRYVIPLAPFISLCFYFGIFKLLQIVTTSNKQFYYLPFLFLILVPFMINSLKEIRLQAKSSYPPSYRNYFLAAQYLEKNSPKGAIICARKPWILYFYCKRYIYNYLFTSDDKKLIKDLVDKDVDYVVLDQLGYSSTYIYLLPAIKKNPTLFKPVLRLQNPDTYVLLFNKSGAKNLINSNSLNKNPFP